jgi:hypothetical protein
MRVIGTTLFLDWEDITEGLAADHSLSVPPNVKKIHFSHEALEMARLNLDISSDEGES